MQDNLLHPEAGSVGITNKVIADAKWILSRAAARSNALLEKYDIWL